MASAPMPFATHTTEPHNSEMSKPRNLCLCLWSAHVCTSTTPSYVVSFTCLRGVFWILRKKVAQHQRTPADR